MDIPNKQQVQDIINKLNPKSIHIGNRIIFTEENHELFNQEGTVMHIYQNVMANQLAFHVYFSAIKNVTTCFGNQIEIVEDDNITRLRKKVKDLHDKVFEMTVRLNNVENRNMGLITK